MKPKPHLYFSRGKWRVAINSATSYNYARHNWNVVTTYKMFLRHWMGRAFR